MHAGELYQQGKLQPAIDAAIADVKRAPTDVSARYLLCQLLCFSGDLERVDLHFDAIASQDPPRAVVVAMQRQLLRAEQWRRQFFEEGRVPELAADGDSAVRLTLEASIRIREGDLDAAADLIAQAADERPTVRGTCDGHSFEGICDLDDLLAPVLEVLTSNGKYYWVPWPSVERIEFRPPENPFDLVWRAAQLELRDGPDGEVFIPALYAGTHRAENDDALRLGRATQWDGEQQGVVRGLGQKMLLIGDEDRSIMDVREIRITT
jgi:type VI secretion system protein ImpE